jgi:hypothetical protein
MSDDTLPVPPAPERIPTSTCLWCAKAFYFDDYKDTDELLEVLKEHLETCPTHPMRDLERLAVERLERLSDAVDHCERMCHAIQSNDMPAARAAAGDFLIAAPFLWPDEPEVEDDAD